MLEYKVADELACSLVRSSQPAERASCSTHVTYQQAEQLPHFNHWCCSTTVSA